MRRACELPCHPYFHPYNSGLLAGLEGPAGRIGLTERTRERWPGRSGVNYTIFEGTSEIQRLVVARSISGLHIP